MQKNPCPYDVEINGVMRKHFSDAEAVLSWWETIGQKTYRYAATNWDVNLTIFLDARDWLFSNDKIALVKTVMQWEKHAPTIVWRGYDPKHPIMGDGDDGEWIEKPEGWWEIEGLPFGLTSFSVISMAAYGEYPHELLDKHLPEIDRERAIIDGIFRTGGLIEDDDPESIGMRGTHDVEFLDTTKSSLIQIIQDDLADIADRRKSANASRSKP